MSGPSWVESNFCKRECIKFIPSSRDNARCCCGQLWQYHYDGSPAILGFQQSVAHWSPSRYTHLRPTDAFGTIEFQGGAHPTKAQYVRLAHDSRPETVIELLTKEWNLDLPKLLITVQGGKTNFELQPKLKKVIRKGLLKATKTTGAWIFTAGTNSGVTRHVGEAFVSESSLRMRPGRVVSIGIAPWGVVERRHELIGMNKDIPYHAISVAKSRFVALNSHHTYFLLVDNGTTGKYGAEIILRRKLENYISHQRIENGGLGTPVVCVVIEGGPQTIRQVLEYVTDNPPVPVIVCDGTGRAADILAFVHKYAMTDLSIIEANQQRIVALMERVFELKTEQALKLFTEVLQLMRKKEMISVFYLKEGSELDQCILSALLHSQHLNPSEQLSLALTWNRVDIARSYVFNEDIEWHGDSLEQAMMDALENDRIEFVKLLLEQGVTMTKFVTIQRLEDLYNSKQGPVNTLRYIIRDVKKNVPRDYRYTLIDIGLVINKLMGGAFRSSYTRKKFRYIHDISTSSSPKSNHNSASLLYGKSLLNRNMTSKVLLHRKDSHVSPFVFEYPFSELLVWAVLTNRQKMALLMWQHGEEALAKALVAAKLYKALANEAAEDDLEAEVYDELRAHAKEFENLALGVLDFCYHQDDDRAHQLLTYELKNWSKQTCLSLAVAVNHRALLSHPCCQILLADLWLGGLRTRKNTNLKVVLGLILPPLLLFLGFRSREELRKMPQTKEEHCDDELHHYTDSESESESDSDNMEARNENDPEVPLCSTAVLNQTVSTTVSTVHARSCFRQSDILPAVELQLNGKALPASVPLDATFFSETRSKPLPVRTKLYEFYNAPITKFWAHSMAYVIFLCFFTYVVLVKLPDKPEWMEWYVIAYISMLLLEKIREIISTEPIKLRQKLDVWSNKLWNVFDLGFAVFFFIGLPMRLQSSSVSFKNAGRVIYCTDIIYWYLRILEILSAHKYLGPFVMMMGKMVKNMAYFVILLLVVLMAFGVCRQSILFPNEEPHWRLVRHIFYQPYFMLYGEVFAGDIDPDCGGEGQIPCHPGRWITPTVMSMYLLVANILLINLLIAVFNNIFTTVNAISHQVWMFQRFQVVMEFEEKPVFPPPLIILSHVHRAVKYLHKKWTGKTMIYDHGLKLFLDGDSLERIHDFEEECVDDYIRSKELREQNTTEERVKLMCERIEGVAQRTEDIHAKLVGSLSAINNVEYRLKRLQAENERNKEGYSAVLGFMLSHMEQKKSSRSGSGSPRSGRATPLSTSQTSLHRMIEETQKSLFSRSSTVETCGETSEEETSEEEVETLSGRHGPVVVRMQLPHALKRSSSYRVQKKPTQIEKGIKAKDDSHLPRVKAHEKAAPRRKKSNLKQVSRKTSTDDLFPCPSRVSFGVTKLKTAYIDSEDDAVFGSTDHSTGSGHHQKTYSDPDLTSSCPQYNVNRQPSIRVIPSSPPPVNLAGEYTSLRDELESACLTSISTPISPIAQVTIRQRHYSEVTSAGLGVNHLREAEETDFFLMESLIRRRMHRDSENLAVSLEDLGSIRIQETSDESNAPSRAGSTGDVKASTSRSLKSQQQALVASSSDYLSVKGSLTQLNITNDGRSSENYCAGTSTTLNQEAGHVPEPTGSDLSGKGKTGTASAADEFTETEC